MERGSLTYLKWGWLFLCFHFYIGRVNLLPDFVGMLLLFGSIQSHSRRTEAEERLKPLLLVLAADKLVHWVIDFQNGLESLLAMVVFLYTIFVFLGEVADRVRPWQPDRAELLEHIRRWMVLLQTVSFLVSAYGNDVLNGMIVVAVVVAWIVSAVTLWGIKPCCPSESDI